MAALSTSLIASVPLVLKSALLSVKLTVAMPSTAASLVPRILTTTEELVPSALVTLKVSVLYLDPTSELSAREHYYDQAALASME